MDRKDSGHPAPLLPAPTLAPSPRLHLRSVVERLIAGSYSLTYDAIVRSFEPYQSLLREVTTLVDRSSPGAVPPAVKILDVACGTGTVALELARCGYAVVGLDVVGSLVQVARNRTARESASKVTFHHLDVARDEVPGAGAYDVVLSMHTLYWHPDPKGLLEGCRRALKPRGHGIFLTYSRPAPVLRTFREIRARQGTRAATRALRWLVPTSLFEMFRHYEPHYLSPEEFHRALRSAGFDVLEVRKTFLAEISLLAWTRVDTIR